MDNVRQQTDIKLVTTDRKRNSKKQIKALKEHKKQLTCW